MIALAPERNATPGHTGTASWGRRAASSVPPVGASPPTHSSWLCRSRSDPTLRLAPSDLFIVGVPRAPPAAPALRPSGVERLALGAVRRAAGRDARRRVVRGRPHRLRGAAEGRGHGHPAVHVRLPGRLLSRRAPPTRLALPRVPAGRAGQRRRGARRALRRARRADDLHDDQPRGRTPLGASDRPERLRRAARSGDLHPLRLRARLARRS